MQKKHWYNIVGSAAAAFAGAALAGAASAASDAVAGGQINMNQLKGAAIGGAITGVAALLTRRPSDMTGAQMPKPQDPPKS